MQRREFIKQGTVAAAGFAILPSGNLFGLAKDKVRLGYIGVGLRGRDHVNEGLLRDDVGIFINHKKNVYNYDQKAFRV